MRKLMALTAAFTALTASTALAGQVEFGNGVYSPQSGVICDGQGKWCADGTGLSASWTEQYFGGAAAGKLNGATQDVFGFSNNVTCETASQTCSGGAPAGKMQAALFGTAGGSAPAAAGSGKVDYGTGVYSPAKGIICDERGNWCADGTGLSASITEQYFGADAASQLSGATQDVFGFSNHVKCDVNSRSCSGGAGKAAKKMAKMLFGR